MPQTRPMPRIDSTSGVPGRPRVVAASWSVVAVFALAGFMFASWVSRIPAVRDDLSLSPATIGLILLVGSIGSVGALPLTGAVVTRLGTRRTVVVAATIAAIGYILVVGGFLLGSVPAMAVAMAIANVGVAGWDVAMNIEGAMVEQGLGRAIMPVYHAGFSGGTVLGAAIGALMARLDVPLQVHLPVAMGLALLAVVVSVRWFLPEEGGTPHAATAPEGGTGADAAAANAAGGEEKVSARATFAAWLEPRTLLIGLVVLSAALTEGAANDWLSLASIESFDLTNSDAALMLTVFLVAMTVMRFIGTRLLDVFGRVVVLRFCIASALAGLLLFGLAPSVPLGIVGIVLWGLGAALGFPVGMSAASDDPKHAAARVSVVSTIGYTAFLAGPPLLGLLAEHVGYANALLAITVPLLISLFLTGATRPLPGSVGAVVDPADADREP